ncbi:MAG TPA: hypothetical protein VFG46_04355, partial [Chryseolinea sp.]|nr:hypothetical protein [Chryseolinea sp.]
MTRFELEFLSVTGMYSVDVNRLVVAFHSQRLRNGGLEYTIGDHQISTKCGSIISPVSLHNTP